MIISIVMWLVIGIGSGYCLFNEFGSNIEFTRIIILLYLMLFSVVGITFEIGILMVRQWFTFLGASGGKGIFFIFCGTLGISFGFTMSPFYKGLPALFGIAAMVVGVLLMILGCMNKNKAADNNTTELPAVAATGSASTFAVRDQI